MRIAINGFGRIGRLVFRRIREKYPELEITAINDLADPKTMGYLLKNDSSYGSYQKKVEISDDKLVVGGERIELLTEKDPENLPWKELKIDLVLECTGFFRNKEEAEKHLKAGAQKVIISAPAKSDDIPTYLLGVNEEKFSPEDKIISMGSCTTNCLAPLAKILEEEIGLERGLMTTVHSYTTSQNILDGPHKKDLRRGRSGAINIVPTTTGAAKTVEKCLPSLKGKLDGLALRVPTPTVSIVDFVIQSKKKTSSREVNAILKKYSQKEELKEIFAFSEEPLVSSDYKGSSYSSIVDGLSTNVLGNLVKVLAWYDNEYGYACRLADMAEFSLK